MIGRQQNQDCFLARKVGDGETANAGCNSLGARQCSAIEAKQLSKPENIIGH